MSKPLNIEELLNEIMSSETDLGVASRLPFPVLDAFSSNRYQSEATHRRQNDVSSLMDVLPDLLESSEFKSWMHPIDGWSRALGGVVQGRSPLEAASDWSGKAPYFSEALMEKGVPEWLATLAEFATPDPIGARKATDLLPLIGFVSPNIIRRLGIGASGDELVKTIKTIKDAKPASTPGGLFSTALNRKFDSERSRIFRVNDEYLRSVEVKIGSTEISIIPDSNDMWYITALKNEGPPGSSNFIEVMDSITRAADAAGVMLTGVPEAFAHKRLPTSRLYSMYNKFGFELAADGKSVIRKPLPLDNEQARAAEAQARRLRKTEPIESWNNFDDYGNILNQTEFDAYEEAVQMSLQRYYDVHGREMPNWMQEFLRSDPFSFLNTNF